MHCEWVICTCKSEQLIFLLIKINNFRYKKIVIKSVNKFLIN